MLIRYRQVQLIQMQEDKEIKDEVSISWVASLLRYL